MHAIADALTVNFAITDALTVDLRGNQIGDERACATADVLKGKQNCRINIDF